MSALTYVTADGPFIDSGNTAWVLAAAALVLFMTPGLAFFYGGMVRTKSVLNMMMMSFITMGTVGTAWILWGYSEAFGADAFMGLVGNPFDKFGLSGVFSEIVGYVPANARTGAAAPRGVPAAAFRRPPAPAPRPRAGSPPPHSSPSRSSSRSSRWPWSPARSPTASSSAPGRP